MKILGYTVPYAAVVLACIIALSRGCPEWFLMGIMAIATGGFLLAADIFGNAR